MNSHFQNHSHSSATGFKAVMMEVIQASVLFFVILTIAVLFEAYGDYLVITGWLQQGSFTRLLLGFVKYILLIVDCLLLLAFVIPPVVAQIKKAVRDIFDIKPKIPVNKESL